MDSPRRVCVCRGEFSLTLLCADGLGSMLILIQLPGGSHVYLDLPRLALRFLLQFQTENTSVILGLDAFRVDGAGNRERAIETAVAALDAMDVPFLGFALESAVALHGQGVVFQSDIEVLQAHAGNLNGEHELVLVLIDVDRGNETSSHQFVLSISREVLEQTVHTILQSDHVAEGIPTINCHKSP